MGKDIGGYVALSIGLFLVVSIVGGSVWVTGGGLDALYRRLENRRAPAAHNWVHFPGFDGAFEHGHANGTANDTITATTGDVAQDTTHASADDTGTSAATGDANGAASEPH